MATRIRPQRCAPRGDRLAPRRRPAQARSRATAAAILEAAARVFAARGYAGGTTNHIAARAGVSIGSLYEYFPNKDAILVALLEAHLDDAERVLGTLVREAAAAGTPSLGATVRRFVGAMVDLHTRDPGLHRVLFEQAPIPRRVRHALAALEDAGVRAIEELLRRAPEATVGDPRLAARLVVQAVEALTHRLVLDADGAVRARGGEEIARLVTRYLTARPARGVTHAGRA